MIHRVLDLGNVAVREIMVPRNDVVPFPWTPRSTRCWKPCSRSGTPGCRCTRRAEKIVGILHYKDLLPVWEERRRAIRAGPGPAAFHIARLIRPHLVVPRPNRSRRCWMSSNGAVRTLPWWWTSFGTIVGCNREGRAGGRGRQNRGRARRESVRRVPEAEETELDGAPEFRRSRSEFGIEIPADAGFETLAGFCSFAWPDPHRGETVEYQGRRTRCWKWTATASRG